LDVAFQRLRADFTSAHQLDRFEAIKSFLSQDAAAGDYERVSRQLGITTKAVGVAVHRLRQRYRQLVRQEVADTLIDARDVEEELHDLFH
jgi:RNA polymerase sigma-70 factor (ECF subfamily)